MVEGIGVGFFEEEGDRGADVGQGGGFLESAGTARCRARAVDLVGNGVLEWALAGGEGWGGIRFGLRTIASFVVLGVFKVVW